MKLPDGWEIDYLDNVTKRGSGHTPNQKYSEYWNGGIKWISLADSSRLDRRSIASTTKEISEEGLNNSSAVLHPKGTVLMSRDAGVGKSSIMECDMAVSQHFITWECKSKNIIDNLFLYYWLQAKKGYFERQAVGSTIKTIGLPLFKKLKLSYPPLPEQKAIADLLSTWDEAIGKTERLIQAKEKQLDAYGKELFKRKNEIKYDGWKQVALKDVLTEHGDRSTGKEEVYSVSVHKGLVNQVEHLGRSFSAANTDHYNNVHYGDIVYTKSPTGDFPLGIVKQSHTKEDVIISPLYGVFTPASFSLGVVIDFYFSSPTRSRNYLFPIIQKGAKNTIAITNKTFLSRKLYLPLDEEAQNVVSEYVITSKKEIDLLKQLAERYKIQKRGLMQKMLTGEWRVMSDVVKSYEKTHE
jgi:type I restriction enzyme S subunit